MATGTFTNQPTPPPVQTPNLEAPPTGYENLVEQQLRRTRAQVKAVEIVGNTLLLIVGAMGFLLALAIVDHWIVGLGFWLRLLALVALVGGAGWWFAMRILPLIVRRINPVYAAYTIEQAEPSLKNSLINFLLLRSRRQQVHEVVYQAVGERAASDLSHVPAENAVDHSHLIRLGYVLAALLAIGAAYKILSPKDPLQSVARVIAPWADIEQPSRVDIDDVRPLDVSIFQGEQVEVSALVRGIRSRDDVRLIFSTLDGQVVEEAIVMQLEDKSGRHEAVLPADPRGAQTGLQYKIVAGDAQTRWHNVEVLPAPHIRVTKVVYQSPRYMQREDEESRRGDIDGIVGQKVTLFAQANREIESAYLEFDPVLDDSSSRDPEKTLRIRRIKGQELEASFYLRLSEDGSSPWRSGYCLHFTGKDGHRNREPVMHTINVKPDIAPLVEILMPLEKKISVPADGKAQIEVRAVDPDFALSKLRLVGIRASKDVFDVSLLDAAAAGRKGQVVQKYEFQPKEFDLQAGDIVEYWAVVEDNRTAVETQLPAPNVTRSRPIYQIEITPPEGRPDEAPPEEKKDGAPGNRENPDAGENGSPDGQPQGGQNGNAGENNSHEKNGEGSQENAGGSDNTSGERGGEGTDADQNNSSERSGESGGEGSSERSQGGGSGNQQNAADNASSNNAENGSSGAAGDGASGTQDGNSSNQQGASSSSESGASDSASTSPDSSNGSQGDGSSGQSGQNGGGKQPHGESAPPDKPIENDGSRDGDIFDAIDEHRRKQQQQNNDQGGNADSGGNQSGQSGEQSGQDRQDTGSAASQNPSSGADQQNAGSGNQQDGQPNSQGQNSAGGNQAQGQQSGKDGAGQQSAGGNSGGNDSQQGQQPGDTQSGGENGGNQQGQKPNSGQGGQEQPGGSQGSQNERNGASGQEQSGNQSDGGQQQNQPKDGSGGSQPQSSAGGGNDQNQQQPSGGSSQSQGGQPQGGQKPDGEKPPGGGQQGQQQNGGGQGQNDKSGAGQQSGGGGSPQSQAEKPQQKNQQSGGGGGGGQKQEDGGKSPAGSQQGSQSQGESGGDRQGGGSQGGGQGAQKPGQDSAGSGSSGEQGDGAANEPGSGQTGNRGGGDQIADQPTGRSGEQPGNGSTTDSAGGGQQQQGSRQGESQQGDGSRTGGQPGGGQPQDGPADPKNQQPGDQPGQAGNNPYGGGEPGERKPRDVGPTVQPGGDEANLEYARKSTDLVLEYLKDQKDNPDPRLLEKLGGWTKDDVNNFLKRHEEMRKAASADGAAGERARRKLDDTLRSLGLRPPRDNLRTGEAGTQRTTGQRDAGTRTRPPKEYAEQFRAFSKFITPP